MSVCPALRRTEGGFVCGYTGKPIDPFGWYCIGSFRECPIYIRQRAEAKPAAPAPQQAAQSAIAPVVQALPRAEAELERAIKPVIDNLVLKYDEALKKLEAGWREYEASVLSAKRQWEVEKMSLMRSHGLLSQTVAEYERMLAELELKREFMAEEAYQRVRGELEEKLQALRALLQEVEEKYRALEDGLGLHFRRVLNTSTSAEVVSLKLSLAKLDDLLKEGRISREVYERLRKELEGVGG